MSRTRSWLPLAFVLSSAGCAGFWGRRPLEQATPIKPDQPVWIWTSRGVEKWHDVVVTEDSVTGTRFDMPLQCPRCRHSIPRSQVDSMTLGYHTGVEHVAKAAGTVTVLVGIVATATVLDGVVCYLFDRGDPQC
ncbi:MAG TPA: hypothetical protein VFP39_11395 [Gemmatimonadales bacterium]|nr:hypothetical protein [Gemmatimonadales bacterium]